MNSICFVFALILAILISILIIILIVPINLEVKYDGKGVDIKLRILIFNINIDKKTPKNNDTSETNDNKGSSNKKSDLSAILKHTSEFRSLFKDSKRVFLKAIKSLKIKNIEVLIYAPGKDSFETATNYGRICSIVYPIFSALMNINEPDNYSVAIRPNFFENENLVRMNFFVRFRVIDCVMIFSGIIFKIAKISRK